MAEKLGKMTAHGLKFWDLAACQRAWATVQPMHLERFTVFIIDINRHFTRLEKIMRQQAMQSIFTYHFFLFFAAFCFTMLLTACSQTDSLTRQTKEGAEEDILLNSGKQASPHEQKAISLHPFKQAPSAYNREIREEHSDNDKLTTMNILAFLYSGLGQHDKALILSEQSLKLSRAKLGEDHPDTLNTMNVLATTYFSLGQHDKALVLNEQALKLRRAKLGEDHPDTLASMNNQAVMYSTLGQYDKALVLNEQTLKLMRAKLGEDHPDTLASMSNLASDYYTLGQNDKALVLNEQTLKLRRAKLGEDHPDTLASINNQAGIYNALGQYDKALVLNEHILKINSAKLGEDHPVTLASMNNMAVTYNNLGQHNKALALNEQTLKLNRAKLGEDHFDTLKSMNNLAVTYRALGQYDKALALKEQTLKLMLTKLGENHPVTLALMNNLADTYSDLGLHDKAQVLKEQTLKLMREKLGEDHPNTLTSMSNLAISNSDLGQLDKALVLNEQTLRLRRAKLGEDHPDTLVSMNNLATTFSDIGQHDKALALKEQTLYLIRTKLGEDHPNTLASMNNLAVTYSDLGQHDKALVLKEQLLKLMRAKLGEGHPDTLASMSNLAVTYKNLGQYDKALVLEEQTLKLRSVKLGDDHPDTLISMSNLTKSYNSFGQHDKALALNEQTLKLRRAKLGEDHPDTLKTMNDLAVNYYILGQHNKAQVLIPSIVASAEKLRALPGLSTEQRQSVFANYSDIYQLYTKLFARAQHPNDSFNLGDLSKARTLTDNIKEQAALRSLPEIEQQKLQVSEARARQLQARIEALSTQGTRDSNAVLALQKELDAHNTAHKQLVADLSRRFPKYTQLTNLKPATVAQAKQLLGKDEVFVSLLLTTKGEAQAFVLDAGGEAKWVDLGMIENHAKTVAAYRELVSPSDASLQGSLVALEDGGYQWLLPEQSAPQGDISATHRSPQTLIAGKPATPAIARQNADNRDASLKILNRYWHDTLIKPLLPLIAQYRHWIISPDKDLALLPFDTLPEVFDAVGEPTQILAQTRDITLVQSFAVFALLKQREAEYSTLHRPKVLFAMGNAVYADGWEGSQEIKRGSDGQGYTVSESVLNNRSNALAPMQSAAEQYAVSQLVWRNLPGTAREVEAVSTVFGGNAKGGAVDSYLGLDASEDRLQQINQAGQLKDYRYLLFSAHGYLAQNPALSSLVLSLRGNPPEIDGYVTAAEWPLYDMKSDLTVLSACDTGIGKTQAGESVMGLPYALFVAGNKNTLLSLWPVDDDATAEFMRRFFTKIKAGAPQPDALRQTKQEFMQHPKWRQPKYWAAFVLYGV